MALLLRLLPLAEACVLPAACVLPEACDLGHITSRTDRRRNPAPGPTGDPNRADNPDICHLNEGCRPSTRVRGIACTGIAAAWPAAAVAGSPSIAPRGRLHPPGWTRRHERSGPWRIPQLCWLCSLQREGPSAAGSNPVRGLMATRQVNVIHLHAVPCRFSCCSVANVCLNHSHSRVLFSHLVA